MVEIFEAETRKPNPQPNPYETVVVGKFSDQLPLFKLTSRAGLTEHQVRLQFQMEEESEARKGRPARHKVTPSTFIAECLDVEEEQCVTECPPLSFC